MFWDVPPPVTLNTGDLTIAHWYFLQTEQWLAVDNGLKTGDSWYYQLGVNQQPHKTIYSCHFLLERLFSENALAITSIPMEVWLNNKPFGSLGH